MGKFVFWRMTLLFAALLMITTCAQTRVFCDSMSSAAGWKTFSSEQVDIKTAIEETADGPCLRMDYNFLAGSGYGGVVRKLRLDLPKNYEFSFWLKAQSPVNNLEFKLADSTGTTVWWHNSRGFEFPTKWTRMVIKQRQISKAWGPLPIEKPSSAASIEFVVSSVNGGHGTLWLRMLELTEKPEISQSVLPLLVSASSEAGSSRSAAMMIDDNPATGWQSAPGEADVNVTIDFQCRRECGGLEIDWDKRLFPDSYSVSCSDDRGNWEKIYSADGCIGGKAVIPFKDIECRYIKIDMNQAAASAGCRINNTAILPAGFSENRNNIFEQYAAAAPRGMFPRYFLKEASYFNVIGVDRDTKEALISEDGQIECDKLCFSLEPFVYLDGKLITWNDVKTEQALKKEYLPIPIVKWISDKFDLVIEAFADGEPGASLLNVNYNIINKTNAPLTGKFYVAVRPFQVNPSYQFLNTPGGAARIRTIEFQNGAVIINKEKSVLPLSVPVNAGFASYSRGDITAYLRDGRLPPQQSVSDPAELASGAIEYRLNIRSGRSAGYAFAIPFHRVITSSRELLSGQNAARFYGQKLNAITRIWEEKLNFTKFGVPRSAAKYINSLRSNLAYILINKDSNGTQPGSRSYERSWIRDGSMTCSALLKFGMTDEVKDFIKWYSAYQYPSGKIPCVVDRRGPDPVPENDSHGEFIFLVYEYFKFTGDTTFLRQLLPAVTKTVAYMDTLIASQSTRQYLTDTSLQAYYGLMPPSISHEGYSEKPMHSYWDDFFTMKGFKDAVEIARVLKAVKELNRFTRSRDEFRKNFYNSITSSVRKHNINYIPGCADLGDFDATSTAISMFPCGERKYLPKDLLGNTFERYYRYFAARRDSIGYNWVNYTPYELRSTGAFLYMGMPEKSHELLDFFFKDQLPAGWNHWAEVVWKDRRSAKFIGDMPHTWVGSDYVNSLRAMFVYEDEDDKTLIIGAGIKEDWMAEGTGIDVKDLRTYYGRLSISARRSGRSDYTIRISGSIDTGRCKMVLALPVVSPRRAAAISINGRKTDVNPEGRVELPGLPAELTIKCK